SDHSRGAPAVDLPALGQSEAVLVAEPPPGYRTLPIGGLEGRQHHFCGVAGGSGRDVDAESPSGAAGLSNEGLELLGCVGPPAVVLDDQFETAESEPLVSHRLLRSEVGADSRDALLEAQITGGQPEDSIRSNR